MQCLLICSSNCDRLDVLVAKVPAMGGRRENWKIKVDQMKADVRSLQSDFYGFQSTYKSKGILNHICCFPYMYDFSNKMRCIF